VKQPFYIFLTLVFDLFNQSNPLMSLGLVYEKDTHPLFLVLCRLHFDSGAKQIEPSIHLPSATVTTASSRELPEQSLLESMAKFKRAISL
jgi:hypothetical protein